MSSVLTVQPRPRRAWAQQIRTLLVATCLTLLAVSAGAAARTTEPSATVSSAALHSAVIARTTVQRRLAHNSAALRRCLRRHPRRCGAKRSAVRRLRARLAGAERRVRSLTASVARRHHTSTGTPTPTPTPTVVQTPPAESKSASPSAAGTTTEPSGTTGGGTTTTTKSPGAGATTEPSPGGTAGPFEMGVVAGSALGYELPFIQKLGARTARMEFEVGTPVAQLEPVIEAYAKAGIRPLLLASFYGTLPTVAQAQSLAGWAARFGPSGSFWQGKSFPAGTAVTDIEFGNETSYSYQYTENTASGYASRAQTYALRFEEAQAAVHAANASVGLLAQGDPGNAGVEWVNNMFKAVPNLGQLVAGWTVHPYGPNWQTIMDKVVSATQSNGAPSSVPLYVTEWGVSSDNGRCLDGNYGWNPCMTYAEASSALSSTIAGMRSRYGTRLASVYTFQAHDQATTGTTTSFGRYFGALQSDGSTKGSYTTTVESLLASNP
jgi:hypothetical protein